MLKLTDKDLMKIVEQVVSQNDRMTNAQQHAAFYLAQAEEQHKRAWSSHKAELQQMIDGTAHAGNRLSELCGDYIGGGLTRNAYDHLGDPHSVIKFGPIEQTKTEYEMWQKINTEYPELKKWFAPVTDYEYPYLVQARCEMLEGAAAGFPKRIPYLFKFLDPYLVNFSRLDGRIVCHDYGWTDGKSVDELFREDCVLEMVAVKEIDTIVRLGMNSKEKKKRKAHRAWMRRHDFADMLD